MIRTVTPSGRIIVKLARAIAEYDPRTGEWNLMCPNCDGVITTSRAVGESSALDEMIGGDAWIGHVCPDDDDSRGILYGDDE